MTEDLAPFFADFATTATIGGAAVPVIFDNAWALAAVGFAGMSGTGPSALVMTARLAADPIGVACVINSVTYSIATHEPDGTGLSLIRLERS